MLVLSRKKGESIVIQGRIRISVLDVAARKVRIGIEAPHDMAVYRREVWEAIMAEEQNAMPSAESVAPHDGLLSLVERMPAPAKARA
jgi:carbon storage regulator